MAIITRITAQVNNPDRVSVYLDGRFCCGLKADAVFIFKLKEGEEIDADKLSLIQFENEKDEALENALGYLSRAVRTKKQVADYLKKKGYGERVIEYVQSKLDGYGYTDDAEYAKMYAESRGGYKGKRLIKQELKAKGVKEEDMQELIDGIDDSNAAFEVLNRYLKSKERDFKTLSKAFRHLISKGFEYETAKEALHRLKEGEFDE